MQNQFVNSSGPTVASDHARHLMYSDEAFAVLEQGLSRWEGDDALGKSKNAPRNATFCKNHPLAGYSWQYPSANESAAAQMYPDVVSPLLREEETFSLEEECMNTKSENHNIQNETRKPNWGPFRPFPLLLSDSILSLGWQEKYLLLRQVFLQALISTNKLETSEFQLKDFVKVLDTYPCVGKAYIPNLFAFLDCKKTGRIEETEFIGGMLAASPDAPHSIPEDASVSQHTSMQTSSPKSKKKLRDGSLMSSTEHDTGISPMSLLRLQIIFLSLDADRDGFLSIVDVTQLICRLFGLLAGEKRSGRPSKGDQNAAMFGPAIRRIIQKYLTLEDTDVRELDKQLPTNRDYRNTFLSHSVSIEPTLGGFARKTIGNFLHSQFRRFFGADEIRRARRAKGKPLLSASESLGNSTTAGDGGASHTSQTSLHTGCNKLEANDPHFSKPTCKDAALPDYKSVHRKPKRGRSITSLDRNYTSRTCAGVDKSLSANPYKLSSCKDLNTASIASSPAVGILRSSSVMPSNEIYAELPVTARQRPFSTATTTRDSRFLRPAAKTESLDSAVAEDAAFSLINSSLTEGIRSVISAGGSAFNVFGTTCSSDSAHGGLFCGSQDVDVESEFRLPDRSTNLSRNHSKFRVASCKQRGSPPIEHGDMFGCMAHTVDTKIMPQDTESIADLPQRFVSEVFHASAVVIRSSLRSPTPADRSSPAVNPRTANANWPTPAVPSMNSCGPHLWSRQSTSSRCSSQYSPAYKSQESLLLESGSYGIPCTGRKASIPTASRGRSAPSRSLFSGRPFLSNPIGSMTRQHSGARPLAPQRIQTGRLGLPPRPNRTLGIPSSYDSYSVGKACWIPSIEQSPSLYSNKRSSKWEDFDRRDTTTSTSVDYHEIDCVQESSNHLISQIPADVLDYLRHTLSVEIANQIMTYYGDQGGLSFSGFLEAVRQNDLPGTTLLFRSREDFATVVRKTIESLETEKQRLENSVTMMQRQLQSDKLTDENLALVGQSVIPKSKETIEDRTTEPPDSSCPATGVRSPATLESTAIQSKCHLPEPKRVEDQTKRVRSRSGIQCFENESSLLEQKANVDQIDKSKAPQRNMLAVKPLTSQQKLPSSATNKSSTRSASCRPSIKPINELPKIKQGSMTPSASNNRLKQTRKPDQSTTTTTPSLRKSQQSIAKENAAEKKGWNAKNFQFPSFTPQAKIGPLEKGSMSEKSQSNDAMAGLDASVRSIPEGDLSMIPKTLKKEQSITIARPDEFKISNASPFKLFDLKQSFLSLLNTANDASRDHQSLAFPNSMTNKSAIINTTNKNSSLTASHDGGKATPADTAVVQLEKDHDESTQKMDDKNLLTSSVVPYVSTQIDEHSSLNSPVEVERLFGGLDDLITIKSSADRKKSSIAMSPKSVLHEIATSHERSIKLGKQIISSIKNMKSKGWIGSCIQSIENLIPRGETEIIPFSSLHALCDCVADILSYEPMTIKIEGEANVISDILIRQSVNNTSQLHGFNFHSALNQFLNGNHHRQTTPTQKKHYESDQFVPFPSLDKQSSSSVVVLGNFVAATHFSDAIELIAILFAIKLLYPSKFILLRGPSEDFFVANAYGLEEECIRRYGSIHGCEIFRRLFDVMEFLPIAACLESPTTTTIISTTNINRDVSNTQSNHKQILRTQKVICVAGDVPKDHSLVKFETTIGSCPSLKKKCPLPSLLSLVSEKKGGLLDFTPLRRMSELNKENASKKVEFLSCNSYVYQTACDDNKVQCRRSSSRQPMKEKRDSLKSLKEEFDCSDNSKEGCEAVQLINKWLIEMTWSHEDLVEFNKRTKNQFPDYYCHSSNECLDSHKPLKNHHSQFGLFFDENSLSSLRFHPMSRSQFLKVIQFDCLVRPVIDPITKERLVSVETLPDLTEACLIVSTESSSDRYSIQSQSVGHIGTAINIIPSAIGVNGSIGFDMTITNIRSLQSRNNETDKVENAAVDGKPKDESKNDIGTTGSVRRDYLSMMTASKKSEKRSRSQLFRTFSNLNKRKT